MTTKQPEVCDVPEIIIDPSSTPNITYKRGRFFGKVKMQCQIFRDSCSQSTKQNQAANLLSCAC
jgi:hypothetical protein